MDTRRCVICNAEFTCRKINRKKTCSTPCSFKYRDVYRSRREKMLWQRTVADPILHEKRNRKKREWRKSRT